MPTDKTPHPTRRPPYGPHCRNLGTITLLDNNRFEVSVYTVTLVSVYTFMVVCTHGI